MKIRSGFVSNSSSASFVIQKCSITPAEIFALMQYNISELNTDGWTISDNGDVITGFTSCDNDTFDEYLEKIGLDQRKMEWHNF